MKALLRNKKGMDYAAMLVLVVIICLLYLYVQLMGKVNDFSVRIGESQVAMLNAFQEGEKALLYVDQSARFSVYKALDSVAQQAGVKGDACTVIDESGKKVNAWVCSGSYEKWLESVQPYDVFNEMMNKQMTSYSNQYTSVSLPENNYEILVQKATVTGIAIAPATTYLQPPTEIREWYVGPISVATAELKKAAIGEYAFRPSFTVNAVTSLEHYDSLKNAVKALYDCTNANSIDSCLAQTTAFTYSRSSSKPDFIICTVKNPAKNPYGTMSDIVFALYAPVPQASTA